MMREVLKGSIFGGASTASCVALTMLTAAILSRIGCWLAKERVDLCGDQGFKERRTLNWSR